MKRLILLSSILLFPLFCAAQNNLEDSAFAKIPVSEILNPVTKQELKIQKKESEKARKRLGYTKQEWKNSYDSFPDEKPIDFDVKTNFLRMPSGNTATFFTVQVENRELSFKDSKSFQLSEIQLFGRIESVDEKMKGTFGENVVFSSNATEPEAAISANQQIYIKGVKLPPGDYKVILILRDSLDGKTGTRLFRIKVPSL